MIQRAYIRSVLQKEWIKLRLSLLFLFGIQAIVLVLYFLKIRHDIQILEAVSVWYSLLFRNFSYFHFLPYLLMASGGILGLVQWIVESRQQRFHLSLRLPVSPVKMTALMVGAGLFFIVSYSFLLACILIGGCLIFFPKEIIWPIIGLFSEGVLGGIALYFCASFIVLEPSWKKRIPLGLIIPGTVWFYVTSANPFGWITGLGSELFFMALLPFLILYSGLRYYYGLYE